MDTNIAVPKKFYTAKYDRIFRSIFVDDEDYTLMEALLSECLDTNVKIIRYLKSELSIRKSNERVKRLDALVEANDKIINVEINSSFDKVKRQK